MAKTYEPISSQTVGTAVASITFSSIPQTYTDLVLITNTGNGSGDKAIFVQLGNGSIDTGSNYSSTFLFGDGAAAVSGRTTTQTSMLASRTASGITGNGSIILQNYSNVTTNKTMLSRGNTVNGMAVLYVGLYRSTVAINTIKLFDESANNFSVGSTFVLYGIKAA
jgi:hypothetical protein